MSVAETDARYRNDEAKVPKLLPVDETVPATPVKNRGEKDGKFMLSEKAIWDGYRDEYCVVIDTNIGEITECREHQKAMAYTDVLTYLRHAGFDEIEVYNDFDRTPATEEAFSVFVCSMNARPTIVRINGVRLD